MKTYEIVAPSNVFPPPTHAALSVRSRCVFIANPLAAHSLQSIDAEAPRVPFTGHVDCLRLSADERNIAVASNDLIKLIDLTKGREIRNLSGHSLAVKALTPRRSSVYSWVSGSLDSSWIVWDSRSHPANVLQGRTTGPVRCVELSPDDTVLAVGTDSNLQLYDIRKRCSLKQFPSSTYGATYHPSQRLVATFGADRVVRFWCLDELVPVAMSDAFSAPIRCAQFACPSPDMEPVLVACTDHYMKTLTCEPCESLAINQIGDLRKVLSMNVCGDGVGAVCTDSVGAVSYCVVPMEDILHGPKRPVDFSDDDDEDESLSDDVPVETMREKSPSMSSQETISVPSTIHVSSSECRLEDSLSSDNNRPSVPVRSSSSERNLSIRSRIRVPLRTSADRNQSNTIASCRSASSIERSNPSQSAAKSKEQIVCTKAVCEKYRRTETDKNLVARPRSPSMPTIHSTIESTPTLRPRESSRLICRSVSPANGNLIKETLPVAPRSLEKPSRVAGTRPPRAHRDWRALVPVPTTAEDPPNPVPRKNSNQGMTVNELVAKQEKEHYMTVMQAEKTAIGVQQLTASLQKGGVSAMLKDALFADELVVTQMLRMLNDTKRWDVNMCDIYLPKLKEFLQDSSLPEPCRQVALASLQSIATGLIDSLRNCARAPLSSIGVDVAAEERKKKAENCIKELRELRDKREQFYRKLTQEEVYRLDAIMVFLKPL